jgi:hypothetical protein
MIPAISDCCLFIWTQEDHLMKPVRALQIGHAALGALATGVSVIGALAIGALAIRNLVIGNARIRRLTIDELVVGHLRMTDKPETEHAPSTSGEITS